MPPIGTGDSPGFFPPTTGVTAMPRCFRRTAFALFALCLIPLASGCGSGETARPDVLQIPADEHFGGTIKSMLYVLSAKMEKRGVKGAKAGLPEVSENMQGYEKKALGSHGETYRQIDQKLKDLDSLLKGSPNDAAVKQAAEELRGLASKLPGTADENPKVE
jgi:hypothetical protein